MRLIAGGIGMVVLLSLSGSASVAQAQSSDQAAPRTTQMAKHGPEMDALLKMFGHGATWEGSVPAGALGPDAPATTSQGRAACGPLVDGFWCRCEVEDTMGAGKDAKTWRGHMIVGYDIAAKSYRGVVVDNTGSMMIYNARMEGGTLTLETPEPVSIMGVMMKDRLTFVAGADGRVKSFKEEHQIGDAGWTPFEIVDHMVPLGPPAAAEKTPPKGGTSK